MLKISARPTWKPNTYTAHTREIFFFFVSFISFLSVSLFFGFFCFLSSFFRSIHFYPWDNNAFVYVCGLFCDALRLFTHAKLFRRHSHSHFAKFFILYFLFSFHHVYFHSVVDFFFFSIFLFKIGATTTIQAFKMAFVFLPTIFAVVTLPKQQHKLFFCLFLRKKKKQKKPENKTLQRGCEYECDHMNKITDNRK